MRDKLTYVMLARASARASQCGRRGVLSGCQHVAVRLLGGCLLVRGKRAHPKVSMVVFKHTLHAFNISDNYLDLDQV